jgi:hypothetical protein
MESDDILQQYFEKKLKVCNTSCHNVQIFHTVSLCQQTHQACYNAHPAQDLHFYILHGNQLQSRTHFFSHKSHGGDYEDGCIPGYCTV